jgi:large subunit ribosomal protein L7/L12
MGISTLDKLRIKQEQLQARIRREQAKARGQERKDDTRRKVLAGAMVLERAEKDSVFATELHKLLSAFLVRPADRALFNLPPLTSDVVNIAGADTVTRNVA